SATNLVEHLRILGQRVALLPLESKEDGDSRRRAIARLLAGLLDDKLRQSLERAFRLLKIDYPSEDIHGVQVASLSRDARARANAGEFLDALLTRHDQQRVRELFRLVCDDLMPAERVGRAAKYLPRRPPRGRQEALVALMEDSDLAVSALAGLYAESIGGRSLDSAIEKARRRRPEIGVTARRLFADRVAVDEAAGG
ncbi:MAG: hypothetical protein M3O46_09300, partial [Myxococcota bacterium]|nr:hypothetical protein [Myxococcota bacterium]